MQIGLKVEKQKAPAAEKGKNSLKDSPSLTAKAAKKKPNVRTADYRQMILIFLTDPDSVTHEEFMFFQSVLGYQQAMELLSEGRKRKRREKAGQPVLTPKEYLDKRAEAGTPGKSAKQEAQGGKNGVGIPEELRTGLEKLSGVDLSNVNVHKNSGRPEQTGAFAYTQGKDIYLAPGQEGQLPHEGWHAVQQKQGRVAPTFKSKTGAPVNDDEELEAEADKMGSLAAGGSYSGDSSKSLGERREAVPDTVSEIIPEITPEESPGRGRGLPQTEGEAPPASGQPDEVVQKKSKNSGNILDIIVNVLDIVGFIPGIGDIADAVNTGIAIIRKQWMNAVLSAIAMIPGLGSAIAAPIKTLVRAAGNITLVKKAVKLLASLLGGLSKVVSKLSGLLNGLKVTLRKLPKLIGSIGDSFLVRLAIGKKGTKAVKAFANSMENGIDMVCKEVDKVGATVRKAASNEPERVIKSGTSLSFKTGKAGEEYLAKLVGGKSQVYFKTSQGGRYIDQLAGDVAYESKVGYTTLTDFVKNQILKDAELIEQGVIKGSSWHFFKSEVTGKGGVSKPLLEFLKQHGITYVIHN